MLNMVSWVVNGWDEGNGVGVVVFEGYLVCDCFWGELLGEEEFVGVDVGLLRMIFIKILNLGKRFVVVFERVSFCFFVLLLNIFFGWFIII